VTPVRHRFGTPRRQEPFDWPLFFRTILWQPVPLWLIFNAPAGPLGAAAPRLLGAACTGRPRAALSSVASVFYLAVVPPLAAAAVYLLAGRRRLTDRRHRLIGDATLLMLAAVSVWYGYGVAVRAAAMSGPLGGLKALCWPARP
jgi:hypothetical protein